MGGVELLLYKGRKTCHVGGWCRVFGLMCLMCCANIFIRGGDSIQYFIFIEVTWYGMMMNDEVAGCFLAGMQY